MKFDYPQYAAPGTPGHQECMWCGKSVFPTTHSCNRVPLTEAARKRAGMDAVCTGDLGIHAAADETLYALCRTCDFSRDLGYTTTVSKVVAVQNQHLGRVA